MKTLLIGALASLAVIAQAFAAASAIFTITIPSMGSVEIALTPVAPCTLTSRAKDDYSISCPGAVAAGTVIAKYTVNPSGPSGWTGGIALSSWTGSANDTSFGTGGTSPNYTLTAGSGIPAGWTGGATATSSP